MNETTEEQMKITVDQIMELEPCPDYTRTRVEGLWGDNESLSLCQILGLDIPIDDRFWAVTQLMPEREARLFAADCAESVLHLFEAQYPDDQRPRLAIEAARKYANGEIDYAARDAARAAAWDAARDAARAAAWAAARAAARDAARAAAWAAARDAARDAARAAAWAAARDAAGAAEQQKQLAKLMEYCKEIDSEEDTND
jgi:hypothetical protein